MKGKFSTKSKNNNILRVEKADKFFYKVMFVKANLDKISLMDKENIFGKMEISILASLQMDYAMEKAIGSNNLHKINMRGSIA